MALYTIQFTGQHFSTTTVIETDKTEFEDIALDASIFLDEHYGWRDVYSVSNEIVITDEFGNELEEG